MFAGFPAEGMAFFRGLKKNNTRDWFQPRKPIFDEKVKAPMLELVAAVQYQMLAFAPDYIQDPNKAIYRIYRDTRFSNDKTPYKTHIAAVFPRRGMAKHSGGGYYFSVSPEEIEVAGGVYMPQPPDLLAIRRHIAANHKEFARLVSARPLKTLMGELWGAQLTRVPKGFPPDHPASDHLRRKQLLFFATLPGKLATSPAVAGEVAKRFRVMASFLEFLNAPLQGRPSPPLTE
jgi:uncharacterized protein (TIGR02453 family)